MKVKNTEIVDNTVQDEEGKIQPSGVSVAVDVEYKGHDYCLDFQTTTTNDYGAYSSRLAAYDGTDDYDSLRDQFDDEDDFFSFLDKVAKESNAEGKWKEYVKANFALNEDHYGGMDANSEVNEAVRIETQEGNTIKAYKEMYEEAMKVTNGEYKGYTKGNALSLYVDEKYRVNAAANSTAHDALCEVVATMSDEEEQEERPAPGMGM